MLDAIEADLKSALLARDEDKTNTLKLLKSALANKKIELKKDLSDEDIMAVIRSEAKKRVEAKEMYEQGGRPESAEKEAKELAILEKYLPAQLNDSELEDLIMNVKNELGDVHMGQIIQETIKRAQGQADGRRISQIVAKLQN